ncbi:hypothetical protein GUITHDRAFT_103301 [Guillardia theta CCMP2712]|uniref:Uncharacterized protein n=2 Tax=Guillardia theta TaxID=55529 RepID=L1JR92_GUITC|nr:hypothetical protein GUITHDRAFT_103301 [Guillardia theta CCMP2712]EKX50710.1 hypothetical protein GUITHDRAFT_103301 [Guillardia theta CCMP2712]|eukprot:XP_005837690.1 hypothetical protein GUITHDRAFT_103301 [Guillardia theta CCMP2712]
MPSTNDTNKMLEQDCNNARHAPRVSKIDMYFYEELLMSGGQKEASEWLSMRKLQSSRSGASSPRSTLSHSTSLPSSCNTSRSQTPTPARRSSIESCREKFVRSNRSDSFSHRSKKISTEVDFELAKLRLGYNAGLLFTDAAHLVHPDSDE